jgi:hypothetical protein
VEVSQAFLRNGLSLTFYYRWIYIIEGLFSVVCAVVVFFGLPNDPGNAYFLSKEQKEFMAIRYERNKAYSGSQDFSWDEVKIAATDPKVYVR